MPHRPCSRPRCPNTTRRSGAYSLDVLRGGAVVVVRFFPPGEWRVSADLDGGGPDHVLSSLGDVVDHLRTQRRSSHPTPTPGQAGTAGRQSRQGR